jgi:hypothetical protein
MTSGNVPLKTGTVGTDIDPTPSKDHSLDLVPPEELQIVDFVLHVSFRITHEAEQPLFYGLFSHTFGDLSEIGVSNVAQDQPQDVVEPFFQHLCGAVRSIVQFLDSFLDSVAEFSGYGVGWIAYDPGYCGNRGGGCFGNITNGNSLARSLHVDILENVSYHVK